jgi:hypothetical protein
MKQVAIHVHVTIRVIVEFEYMRDNNKPASSRHTTSRLHVHQDLYVLLLPAAVVYQSPVDQYPVLDIQEVLCPGPSSS